MPGLADPWLLGPAGVRAGNRLVFGPHPTNLGRRRSISERHVAYYRRRAAGGAGVIVVEEASVHPSDWPYERGPLAADSAEGWAAVARACHDEGAVVLAALGHAGGQGSSAYSQLPLWAPSRVPDVATREVPKEMEPEDIAAVVDGFAAATRLAAEAGLDGVEVNAGQFSLVRQFLSGLTNQRRDGWGDDRLRFAREVLAACRRAAPDGVLALRLSCDELAPWAGITPEAAEGVAAALVAAPDPHVDVLTVVRGSIFTTSATRPDTHEAPGFNLDLVARIRTVLAATTSTQVVAQGSIVDVAMAERAIAEGRADAVEMTRAQIADPDVGRHVHAGTTDRIRPCIRCNQACQVRDVRNPIVSCVGEPSAGHELEDPPVDGSALHPRDVLVVGGGPAGLECARVAALRGHRVRLVERRDRLGGMVRVAAAGHGRGPLAALVDWLERECRRLGVAIETDWEAGAGDLAAGTDDGVAVVLCTGSRDGRATYAVDPAADVRAAAEVLADAGGEQPTPPLPDGAVVVWDPVGGPVGISVAELLAAGGRPTTLVTPDLLAGNELARSGDLAPANVRLQAGGVRIERRSILRRVAAGGAEVEDRFTGEVRTVPAGAVIDAGYRLPDDALWLASGGRLARAGDAVAPRSILEAVLEGRRAALALEAG